MRVLIIIIASLAVLAGAACATAGAATAIIFGPDGRFESDDAEFGSDHYALVFEANDIGEEEPDQGGFDPSDIKVWVNVERVDADEAIFIGLGRADDVDPFVDDLPHEVVTDVEFDPFRLRTEEVAVNGGPGNPPNPAAQDFWLASASGAGLQTIEHGLEGGDLRLVIMNADGSPGFTVRGSLGVEFPYIFWIGIGLLSAGVLVIVFGLVTIIVAAASRPAKPPPPPVVAAAPPAPPPPPPARP